MDTAAVDTAVRKVDQIQSTWIDYRIFPYIAFLTSLGGGYGGGGYGGKCFLFITANSLLYSDNS